MQGLVQGLYTTHIATKDRLGKLGYPCAYPARFHGYDRGRLLEPCCRVILVHPNGTYGVVRISKDIIFDDTIDFKDENTRYPIESEFMTLNDDEQNLDQPIDLAAYSQYQPILNPTPSALSPVISVILPGLSLGHPAIPVGLPALPLDLPDILILPTDTPVSETSPITSPTPKSILKQIAPARQTTALPRQDARLLSRHAIATMSICS